eukprot:COSAG06_NODE_5187_length_3649_cov_2.796901_3_plen_54_part_00
MELRLMGADAAGTAHADSKAGDVVGLLLDLGQRKLSVYVNGVWRGVCCLYKYN